MTTTNSKHWLKKYPNKAKELQVTAPEQLGVSDITYIQTDEGNCYLNLITDAYSRKIMGYSIADNMTTEAMKTAYETALQQPPPTLGNKYENTTNRTLQKSRPQEAIGTI